MAEDKDLPPEERIKKLKKLKEEKEKEIAEAQKKIKESEEGKDILKEQRGMKEGKEKRDYDLEQLAREKIDRSQEILESRYAEQLSREPIGDIYKEMGSIHKAVEEKGYISSEEEKRVEYLSSAVERKLEAEESGRYSFSEEAARAASITKQMGVSMIKAYKSHKSVLYRSS